MDHIVTHTHLKCVFNPLSCMIILQIENMKDCGRIRI